MSGLLRGGGFFLTHCRALESVSIASALSTALTIYPCQIRVHQRWQSKLQLPTARKEWRSATADSSPQAVTCQHCDTQYFSRPRTHNLPIVGPMRVTAAHVCRSLVKKYTSNQCKEHNVEKYIQLVTTLTIRSVFIRLAVVASQMCKIVTNSRKIPC